MKRLLEYQQKRKQQQAEDTKKKRPPFKVGTYKLDSKTTPLKAGKEKFFVDDIWK